MRWSFVVVLGCYAPGSAAVDGGHGDAGTGDAAGDSGGMKCLGALDSAHAFAHQVCVDDSAIAADPMFTSTTLDTDTDLKCLMSGFTITPSLDDACVIAAQGITITTRLGASGGRPLVLWSATSITVDGSLDASSHLGSSPLLGAGATQFAPSCPNVDATTVKLSIPFGGAGGSFAGLGGAGGGSGGASTPAKPAPDTVGFHAGCPGGAGGPAGPPTGLAAGGAGGGAVYLLAGMTIVISDGGVFASGAGGAGGMQNDGGGGGGAGGAIVLYATTVTVDTATLRADGGGGGAGGGSDTTGAAGGDPSTVGAPLAGSGGAPSMAGAGGGSGSLESGSAGPSGNDGFPATSGACGGGGGGTGLIAIHPMPSTTPVTSPLVTDF